MPQSQSQSSAPQSASSQPEQAQPARRRPPARRAARLYSPGSDATTRRLVAHRARQHQAAAEHSPARASTRRAAIAAKAKMASGAQRRQRRVRPVLVPFVLAVVTVVLGGLAAWSGTEAHSLTSAPAARNSALTDTTATSQVRSQVTSAINALFSYNYANPGPTTQAARRLLTGPAVHQYATLFAQVRKDAPGQKLIVTTAVTNIGVEQLSGDQARLLVFATETDRRTSGGQPASAAAMLAVNAVRKGSTWKIETIDTY